MTQRSRETKGDESPQASAGSRDQDWGYLRSHFVRIQCRKQKAGRCLRTSFNGVCFCVVANIGRFGLGDLHQAVLADLSQSKILFVPLQAATNRETRGSEMPKRFEHIWAHCALALGTCGVFLRIPLGLGREAERGTRWVCGWSWTTDMVDDSSRRSWVEMDCQLYGTTSSSNPGTCPQPVFQIGQLSRLGSASIIPCI